MKLGGSITVALDKTLTLRVEGNAEHTVKCGISLGKYANVIIEGDLTQENNKLTVKASDGNAGIGANNSVIAGDITIRNARVDATGSSSKSSPYYISGAGIGTANASMGNHPAQSATSRDNPSIGYTSTGRFASTRISDKHNTQARLHVDMCCHCNHDIAVSQTVCNNP